MAIEYRQGDLFTCRDAESFAHCISADCRMGKGIAVQFAMFPGNERTTIKQQNKSTGQVAATKVIIKENEYWIYNLITKDKYFFKKPYMGIENSLKDMRDHMLENNVKSVAMPILGCGLDRCSWERVSQILEQVFDDDDIKIIVYKLKYAQTILI